MKKLMLGILTGFLIVSFSCHVALAKERQLEVTAAASSVYSDSPYYAASKAVDGAVGTYWLGGNDAAPWWIELDIGSVTDVGRISIVWTSPYFPTDYDIQISSDGSTWTNIYTGLIGEYNPAGIVRDISSEARYIRFYINSVGTYNHPGLREVSVYEQLDYPCTVRFQGILGDSEGIPLDGDFDLHFRLYDVETGGTAIWEETQTAMTVDNGSLDVELGSVNEFDVPFDKKYWLGVEVGTDGEMTPRFKLTAVPYTFTSDEY